MSHRIFTHRLIYRASVCAAAMMFTLAGVGCSSTQSAGDPYYESDPDLVGFNHASNRTPTPQTLRSMARILASQGKDDQAAYVLERVIGQHPNYMPAYSDLAELYLRHGDIEHADSAIEAGLAVSPTDATLLNNRGMCALLQGEYEAALTAFEAAVESAPNDARYHANHATALGMLGRYDEALDSYNKAVPLAESHYNVAVLCELRDDDARAEIEYGRARELGYLFE